MNRPAPEAANVDRYGFVHDSESRMRRARRIVTVLHEAGGIDPTGVDALDIGCSAGLITLALAPSFRRVVGVDTDAAAVAYAILHRPAAARAAFLRASGEALPFPDASFGVVVCNHVYEHVDNAVALMAEIVRVLEPGGICYFAAGHTLQLIEPHYRLPLLSWLPRSLAGRYLRATGRGAEYQERFVAPWNLRELFRGFARVELVSAAMLREPERFGLTDGVLRHRWARRLARVAPGLVARLAPTYLWLLWK